MAEHWISAATARAIVARARSPAEATHPLCERAFAALIKTKARLFTVKSLGRRLENVDVPAAFWWAGGHEALDQDWAAGDFSTWINDREQWQAFGVTFALSGVLEMLPFDERATAARSLSVAGDPAWISARGAVQFANDRAGLPADLGAQAIVAQAQLGFITARAVVAERLEAPPGRRLGLSKGEREWDVPGWFWQHFLGEGSSQDWTHGTFEGKAHDPNGPCVLKLTNLHFLTKTLDVLLPSTTQPLPIEAKKAKAGGRPAQPWWDDLWCAVWGLIHQGDFNPRTQADVEKAMLTWATMNGHEVSEAAVRPKARKLFQALNGEATNFLAP